MKQRIRRQKAAIDFERTAPFDLARYREMRRAIPGVLGLYRLIGAAAAPGPLRRALLVGAGGGREIEALAPALQNLRLTVVDPSPRMLAAARASAEAVGAASRVAFQEGVLEDLGAAGGYDLSTALLVAHFFADDGAKAGFLAGIRARLRPGATHLHADLCIEDRADFDATAPVFAAHAAAAGLGAADVDAALTAIAGAHAVGAARLTALFHEAGFVEVRPLYQGLWYRAWRLRAGD